MKPILTQREDVTRVRSDEGDRAGGRSRLRRIAFGVLIAGLFLRSVMPVLVPDAPLGGCDGRAYYLLAVSLAEGRGLHIDEPIACSMSVEGASHHFAPGLPLIEAAFVALFGDSLLALVLPLLLLSWGAVAVAWWTTRNLYGGDAGLVVAAAVAIEWTGIVYGTWFGYAENLVLLALVLAVWAVLRSLRDDRHVLLAGLFAGIGYLSKASIGWFFLIAGVGGLIWRVLFRGRSILRNRSYWGAIAIFAVPVAIWSLRNVSLFWDGSPLGLLSAWQTSSYSAHLVALALQHPDQLLIGLAGKLPVLALFFLTPFIPLAGAFRSPIRRWREEDASGLWLTAGLILLLGWFFAAVFWVGEQSSLLWADPLRYVMPAQVALLWLLLRERGPQPARAWAISLLVMTLITVSMIALLVTGTNPFGL